MSTLTIKGIVRNGRIEVDQPLRLPEGSEVTIIGVDDDRSLSPEEIADVLAAMERIEPFDIDESEQTSIDAWAKKVNEFSKSKTDRKIEGLFP